ncbi:MAG TPA: NAD(P)H-binding protein [Pilimelia sp.]|nr:NAD(P)H-binding protein [Pilimelia sp.]
MIVITGATGNVGRALVPALAAAGERVTAVSRGPADLPSGVRHRPADLADPESLRSAFDGADALYLLVAGAGAHLNPRDILDVAKAGGVRRVVLQSSQAAGTRPASPSHAPLRAIEDAVRESGLDWTVLRPGGFASNAFAWAPQVRDQRTVAAPFGDVALPTIDPADIAAVAAVVLRDGRHAGRTYELTGPAPVSPRDRAAAIGGAIGAPVRFVEQSPAEARAQLLGFMPAPVVDGTLAILGAPTPAERRVSPDVERVLGRAPRTFADWARRNAAAFR